MAVPNLPIGGAIQKSPNIRYMECLDQLRAVAVLMVFFAHALHNFSRGIDPSIGGWLFFTNPILAVIAEGHSGVALFMVLSGFLFAYGAHQKEVVFFAFMRNRVLRIFPMYVLLLFLGAYGQKETFSFLGFVSSLFMFANTQSALDGGMFTILLWTVSTEFTFYLIFPFLNRMHSHSGKSYLLQLLGLAILLRVICVALGASARDFSYFTIFGRIDQFILGMIAGYMVVEGRFEMRSKMGMLVLSVAIVILTLYAFNRYGGGWVSGSRWKILWPTWEGLIYSLLVVTYLKAFDGQKSSAIGSIFTFIGTISFSVYLLHQPMIAIVQKSRLQINGFLGIFPDALINGAVVLLPVLGISWLTYKLIERPFMDMRKRYVA